MHGCLSSQICIEVSMPQLRWTKGVDSCHRNPTFVSYKQKQEKGEKHRIHLYIHMLKKRLSTCKSTSRFLRADDRRVINESLKMPGAVELSHDGNYLHSPKFITYPNKGKKRVQYFARHIEMEYIQIIKLSLTPIRIFHHW